MLPFDLHKKQLMFFIFIGIVLVVVMAIMVIMVVVQWYEAVVVLVVQWYDNIQGGGGSDCIEELEWK